MLLSFPFLPCFVDALGSRRKGGEILSSVTKTVDFCMGPSPNRQCQDSIYLQCQNKPRGKQVGSLVSLIAFTEVKSCIPLVAVIQQMPLCSPVFASPTLLWTLFLSGIASFYYCRCFDFWCIWCCRLFFVVSFVDLVRTISIYRRSLLPYIYYI